MAAHAEVRRHQVYTGLKNFVPVLVNNNQGTLQQSAILVQSNHADALIISGGTVGSMDGNSVHSRAISEFPNMAIYSTGTGGITIRGSALITSRNPYPEQGTIRLNDATGGSLTIEGGTVRNWNPNNSSSPGPAISVNATDDEARKARVTRTGGTINPMPAWLD